MTHVSPRGAGVRSVALLLLSGVCAGLCAPSPVLAQGSGAPGSQTDPRVTRADGLLASRKTYPEAMALYREVLAEHPGDLDVRQRLARVLSWSDQLTSALAEYDRILARAPDRRDAQMERAEVLSWMGAHEPALEAFDAILERDPRSARAHRGRARTLRWAGRAADADEAYARALDLEEDAEARQEWRELRASMRPRAVFGVRTFSDSSDFDRRDVELGYAGYSRLDTRWTARLRSIHVAHPQEDVAVSLRSATGRDRALELQASLSREWHESLRTSFDVGGRDWRYGGDGLFGRAAVTAKLAGNSFGFHLAREDFLDAAYSFEAVQYEVRQTWAAISLWRPLSARLSIFGRGELGDVSDGNTRSSGYAALTIEPRPGQQLFVTLGASYLAYSDPSGSYYDPERDWGAQLSVQHRLALSPELALDYEGAIGLQSTDDRAGAVVVSESGSLWSLKGGVQWTRGDWVASLRGAVSYSQRSSRYHTSRFELRVTRTF